MTFDINAFKNYEFRKERTEKAIEQYNHIMNIADQEVEMSLDDAHRPQVNIEPELGVADLNVKIYDQQFIDEQEKLLNKEQKYVYDRVINKLIHLEMHKNKQCEIQCDLRPIKMFVSGIAGKYFSI
jgi:hypothetical protein